MTPDGNINPWEEMKRTKMLNKKVNITNSINTYFALHSSLKDVKLYNIINLKMCCWICNIHIDLICIIIIIIHQREEAIELYRNNIYISYWS